MAIDKNRTILQNLRQQLQQTMLVGVNLGLSVRTTRHESGRILVSLKVIVEANRNRNNRGLSRLQSSLWSDVMMGRRVLGGNARTAKNVVELEMGIGRNA